MSTAVIRSSPPRSQPGSTSPLRAAAPECPRTRTCPATTCPACPWIPSRRSRTRTMYSSSAAKGTVPECRRRLGCHPAATISHKGEGKSRGDARWVVYTRLPMLHGTSNDHGRPARARCHILRGSGDLALMTSWYADSMFGLYLFLVLLNTEKMSAGTPRLGCVFVALVWLRILP